jgi:hypothetical protein
MNTMFRKIFPRVFLHFPFLNRPKVNTLDQQSATNGPPVHFTRSYHVIPLTEYRLAQRSKRLLIYKMFFTAGLRAKRFAALDGNLKREPAERNSSTMKFKIQ